jgi:hypothetical protein
MTADSVGQVMSELRQWADTFKAGDVHFTSLLKPRLEPGEKWSVRVMQVGSASIQREDAVDLHSAMRINPEMDVTGLGYATDRRLFIGAGRGIKREWAWSEVHSVVALADFQGVVVDRDPDSGTLDVVATHRTRAATGPNPAAAAADWLKVEGTFAFFRGDFGVWLPGVEDRLRAVYPS